MGNTYGHKIVLPLTNKSGGALAKGDVVIVDTANNEAVTTTTSAASLLVAGVVQEAIANNATGRVLVHGYADLVNVNASVTRGNFGKTHTVAKQATDAGSSRIAGTFCRFLTGGTTPTAYIYPVDLAGAALTNPMTTAGDIIIGGASGVPARLALAAAGKVPVGTGSSIAASYPPGYEYDYVEYTGGTVTISATTEGTANTIVTATATAFGGSTVIYVEFFAPEAFSGAAGGTDMTFVLYDDTGGGAASIGKIGILRSESTNRGLIPTLMKRKLTPSNATHTYSMRAYVNTANSGAVVAGAGGSGNLMPAYIRLVQA